MYDADYLYYRMCSFYEYRDYKRNSNYTYNLCDLLMELTLVITSWIGVVAVIVFVSPGIVMFRKK